jgi:GAF domain-containing protein
MKPGLPPNEPERLRTLRLYHVLDTETEQSFDDLTRLAAGICDVPMASITLVDEHRQWFKARIGVRDGETPRVVSFCAHAILERDLVVVEDAALDPRFMDNPSVTGDPNIRFYAGAILEARGAAMGTLCVFDSRPRQLTATQLDALRILREAVMTQLELRRALHDLDAVQRFVPMCSWCRAIRSDDGQWRSVADFVMDAVPVTHGICPACTGKPEGGW